MFMWHGDPTFISAQERLSGLAPFTTASEMSFDEDDIKFQLENCVAEHAATINWRDALVEISHGKILVFAKRVHLDTSI